MRTLFTLLALSVTRLAGQEPTLQAHPATVRASSEAVVSVRPDQARLRLAIVSTAGTAEIARERNAERTTNLITVVRGLLGQDADIRTVNLSVNKSFSGGLTANNTIEVRLPDPVLIGKVIDAAIKAGATAINGVESSTLDEQDARSEALKLATAQARANAEAIATALGLRVLRVASAEESPSAVLPRFPVPVAIEAKRRQPTPTPVEPRAVEVRARVTVTLDVAP